MILNYDLTFLAMVLSEGGGTCEKRCAVHPFRKRRYACGDAAMDTAADMSVILTWWQIQDGIADHGLFRGLKYRAAALLLGRAYRKARRRQPDFDAGTQKRLTALAELEAERCPSLDRPADAFAVLLAGAAEGIADPVKRRVAEQLLYHLGRWVYLVDAADDAPVLRAAVYEGLYIVGAAVLNGTFHRRRRERQAIRKADTNDA